MNKIQSKEVGATITEFITIGPIIFLLGAMGLQYALMYNAKSNVTYAAYEAARAGAIENATPVAIEKGLLKGMLPYYSANSGNNISNNPVKLLAEIKAQEAPFMKVDIINPTAEAFEDFNSEILQKKLGTTHKVIPNKLTDLNNSKSSLNNETGRNSGLTISEANVLKLRVTYGYRPSIPVIGKVLTKGIDFLNGPKDAYSAKLFAANRIPIVVDVTSQMLSPPVQNGLPTVGYAPGNIDNPNTADHNVPENQSGHIPPDYDVSNLPDLSEINLPEEYEGLSREEIAEIIRSNGGVNNNPNVSNSDWIKILIAVGLVTVGVDTGYKNATNSENSTINVNDVGMNDNLNSVSDFGSSANRCPVPWATTSGDSSISDIFDSKSSQSTNFAPAAGPIVIGGAEAAAGAAILGGTACVANKYCPELVGDILTSAGNGLQNTVEGVLGVFSSNSPKTGNDELDEVLEDAVPTDDGDKGYEYPGTQEELIEKLGKIEGAHQTKRPDGSTSTTLPDGRRVDTYPSRTSTKQPGWQIIKPGRKKPTHKGQTQ